MPTKTLTSQAGRNGLQDTFKFGGGKNTVIAIADLTYSFGFNINTGGGDDTIFGSVLDDILMGGTGNDNITGGLGNDTIFAGEDATGTDAAKGKNAVLHQMLIGDEANVGGGVAGDPVIDVTYTGGNDTIYGADGGNNSIYGDNFGTVVLTAGQTFAGGNDMLVGGDSVADESVFNNLVGDTQSISKSGVVSFIGGNDTLIGGSGTTFEDLGGGVVLFKVSNTMVGDTGSTGGLVTVIDPETDEFVSGFKGGDDILISGAFARDTMIGDFSSGDVGGEFGGNDTFVFATNNGADTIIDFHSGEDMINLNGTGLTSFDDLAGHIADDGTTTVIDIGAALDGAAGIHTVTLMNATGLTALDFDFNPLAIA